VKSAEGERETVLAGPVVDRFVDTFAPHGHVPGLNSWAYQASE
jgi:hypothetical protein